MYETDFDIQVTNYGEELRLPPEYVGRVELSHIFVLENSYGVLINQSTFDRLHFKPYVRHEETTYFDFRNPPVELLQNVHEPSRTVILRTRREGQWVGHVFASVDHRSDLEWDLVVGLHNFPDLGFVWDSSTKQLIPMTSPQIHTINSFREVAQPTRHSSNDLLRRLL